MVSGEEAGDVAENYRCDSARCILDSLRSRGAGASATDAGGVESSNMRNVLSIDVEEYFHATELHTSSKQWSALPSRIEEQVRTVLELLERHKVTATFFILGWIAEHHPNVVREIARAGHEIGCHSHLHRLIFDLTA